MNVYNLLAFIPFLIIIFFMVFKGYKPAKVMFATYIVTLLMLLLIWQVNISVLLASSFKGFFSALEIFLIIISILMLFNLLKENKKLDSIKYFMKSYTDDKNILIVLVGFFLVSFLEGIAGFGTPAAVAVPILVFLGISPFIAIVLCLIADTACVAFGAFGIPVLFGIQSSVPTANISLVTASIGIINGIISMCLPFVLIAIYNYFEHRKMKDFKSYIPFATFSGFSYGISYMFASFFLNIEMISVFASICGFIATIVYLQFTNYIKREKNKYAFEFALSFMPYFLLILMLALSRMNFMGFGSLLKKIALNMSLYKDVISFSFSFYSPGILILLTFVIFSLLYSTSLKQYLTIAKGSFNSSKNALVTLLFTLGFVQMIIYSHMNSLQILGIPHLIGEIFSRTGVFYIFFAPMIGAFGAFVAGSATVSNLIFGPLQSSISQMSIYPEHLILALQTVGGGAGNMVAIHNVIAACSLVGLNNYESTIIKYNAKILFFYTLIAGFIGFLLYI